MNICQLKEKITFIGCYYYSLATIIRIQTKKERKKEIESDTATDGYQNEISRRNRRAWIAVLFCFVLFFVFPVHS